VREVEQYGQLLVAEPQRSPYEAPVACERELETRHSAVDVRLHDRCRDARGFAHRIEVAA